MFNPCFVGLIPIFGVVRSPYFCWLSHWLNPYFVGEVTVKSIFLLVKSIFFLGQSPIFHHFIHRIIERNPYAATVHSWSHWWRRPHASWAMPPTSCVATRTTCALAIQNPWRIHGAGICKPTWLGYIDGIHGTPYIAAPWIRHGKLFKIQMWRPSGNLT